MQSNTLNTARSPEAALVDRPFLKVKLDKSESTIRRWELRGIIPEPDLKVGARKYWAIPTLHAAFPSIF